MFENIRRYIPDPDKVKILEVIIDPEIQIEYFDFAQKVRKEENRQEFYKKKNLLFEPDVPIDEKKKILVILPTSREIDDYKVLERYAQNPDPELKDWALLAYNESKNVLQNFLLDEDYTLISTGLGGKDNRWRFFVILIAKNKQKFTDLQKQVIKKEIEFAFKKYGCELEKIDFGDYFVKILGLFPIDNTIENLFDEVVFNINDLGGFLDENYIVTNVKEYNNEEVEKLISDVTEKADSVDEFGNEFGDFGDIPDFYEDENLDDDDDDEEDDDFDDDDIF